MPRWDAAPGRSGRCCARVKKFSGHFSSRALERRWRGSRRGVGLTFEGSAVSAIVPIPRTKARFVQFGPPTSAPQAKPETVLVNAKPKREKKSRGVKAKNDPKLVAAARELQDRWLEKVTAPGGEGLLIGGGKYEVSRLPIVPVKETPLLAA